MSVITVDEGPELGKVEFRGAGLSSRFALYGSDPPAQVLATVSVPEWFRLMERVQEVYKGLTRIPAEVKTQQTDALASRIVRLVAECREQAWIDAVGVVAPRSLIEEIQQAILDGHQAARSVEGRDVAVAQRALDDAEFRYNQMLGVATGGSAPLPMVPKTASSRALTTMAVQRAAQSGTATGPVQKAIPGGSRLVAVMEELPESRPVAALPSPVAPPMGTVVKVGLLAALGFVLWKAVK